MTGSSNIERVKSIATDTSAVVMGLNLPNNVHSAYYKTIGDIVSQAELAVSAANSVLESDAATESGIAQLEDQAVQSFNSKLLLLDDQLAKVRGLRPTQETQDALVHVERRLQVVHREVRRIAIANGSVGSKLPQLKDRPLGECDFIGKVLASFEGTLRDSKNWWPGWRDFLFRLGVGVLGGLLVLAVRTAIENYPSTFPSPAPTQKAVPVKPPRPHTP
jgi:hypothetical protein